MKNPGIYILTSPSGKQYVGRDSNLPSRVKIHFSGNAPQCRHIHNAIRKYGAAAFDVEFIRYPGISDETLNAIEKWKIKQLQTIAPKGYNLTDGGEGSKPSEETRQKMSESNHKRVEDGIHPFLGGDIPRRAQKKRVEDGTHNFLGDKNPSHRRVEDGTHNFLDKGFHRHRIQKQLENGTHNFLDENHPIKRMAKEGRHPRTLKRLKGQWCYIVALSRFWYEIHDYTLKRRAEFLSKDIPDTSNAKQEYLF